MSEFDPMRKKFVGKLVLTPTCAHAHLTASECPQHAHVHFISQSKSRRGAVRYWGFSMTSEGFESEVGFPATWKFQHLGPTKPFIEDSTGDTRFYLEETTRLGCEARLRIVVLRTQRAMARFLQLQRGSWAAFGATSTTDTGGITFLAPPLIMRHTSTAGSRAMHVLSRNETEVWCLRGFVTPGGDFQYHPNTFMNANFTRYVGLDCPELRTLVMVGVAEDVLNILEHGNPHERAMPTIGALGKQLDMTFRHLQLDRRSRGPPGLLARVMQRIDATRQFRSIYRDLCDGEADAAEDLARPRTSVSLSTTNEVSQRTLDAAGTRNGSSPHFHIEIIMRAKHFAEARDALARLIDFEGREAAAADEGDDDDGGDDDGSGDPPPSSAWCKEASPFGFPCPDVATIAVTTTTSTTTTTTTTTTTSSSTTTTTTNAHADCKRRRGRPRRIDTASDSEDDDSEHSVDGEEAWEVEAILGQRERGGNVEYLVEWKVSWEDGKMIAKNASTKLAQFLELVD